LSRTIMGCWTGVGTQVKCISI